MYSTFKLHIFAIKLFTADAEVHYTSQFYSGDSYEDIINVAFYEALDEILHFINS